MKAIFLCLFLTANFVQGQSLFVATGNNTVTGYSLSGGAAPRTPFTTTTIPVALAYDGHGTLFVASDNGIPYNQGTIGSYGAFSATGNPSLITGLNLIFPMALDNNGHLFIGSDGNNNVVEYSTSGMLLNANLISLASAPRSLAVDNNGHIYVGINGGIRLYSTSGQLLNPSLISGLLNPYSIALDGAGNLYVADAESGVVGKYTTSGQTINANLITGLSAPDSLALDGQGHLYVASAWTQTIGLYTTDGLAINPSFITTTANPISITYVPEPSCAALLILALIIILSTRASWFSQAAGLELWLKPNPSGWEKTF